MARGLCGKHYQRLQRTGTVDLNLPTLEERFWAKVQKAANCWLWTAGRGRDGYGYIAVDGTMRAAHLLAYRWAYGPVPAGLEVDHRCRVKACVNPEHLQAVAHQKNLENLPGPRPGSASGLRGVHFDARRGRWFVQITVAGRRHWRGSFTDLEQAGSVAVALRNELMSNNLADRPERLEVA